MLSSQRLSIRYNYKYTFMDSESVICWSVGSTNLVVSCTNDKRINRYCHLLRRIVEALVFAYNLGSLYIVIHSGPGLLNFV